MFNVRRLFRAVTVPFLSACCFCYPFASFSALEKAEFLVERSPARFSNVTAANEVCFVTSFPANPGSGVDFCCIKELAGFRRPVGRRYGSSGSFLSLAVGLQFPGLSWLIVAGFLSSTFQNSRCSILNRPRPCRCL